MKIRYRWSNSPVIPNASIISTDAIIPITRSDILEHHFPPINDEGEHLAEALGSIAGVKLFYTPNKYDLLVEKGDVFNWEEVRPRVQSVLTEFFGQGLEVVE